MSTHIVVKIYIHISSLLENPANSLRPPPEVCGRVRRGEHFLGTVKSEICKVRGRGVLRHWIFAGLGNHHRGAVIAQDSDHSRAKARLVPELERETGRRRPARVFEKLLDAF